MFLNLKQYMVSLLTNVCMNVHGHSGLKLELVLSLTGIVPKVVGYMAV